MKNNNVSVASKKMMGLNTLVNKLGKSSSIGSGKGFAAFIDTLITNLKSAKSEKPLVNDRLATPALISKSNGLFGNTPSEKNTQLIFESDKSVEGINTHVSKEKKALLQIDNDVMAETSVASLLNSFEKINQLEIGKPAEKIKLVDNSTDNSETKIMARSTFKSFIKELKNNSLNNPTENKVVKKLLKEPVPVQKAVYSIIKEIAELSVKQTVISNVNVPDKSGLKNNETLIQKPKTAISLKNSKEFISDSKSAASKKIASNSKPLANEIAKNTPDTNSQKLKSLAVKNEASKVVNTAAAKQDNKIDVLKNLGVKNNSTPQNNENSKAEIKIKTAPAPVVNKNVILKNQSLQTAEILTKTSSENIDFDVEEKKETKFIYVGRKDNKNRVSVEVKNNQAIVTAHNINKKNLSKASGYIKSLVRNNFEKPGTTEAKNGYVKTILKEEQSAKTAVNENIKSDFLKKTVSNISKREELKVAAQRSVKSNIKNIHREKNEPKVIIKTEKVFTTKSVQQNLKTEANQQPLEISKTDNKPIVKEIIDFNVNKNLKVKFVFTDEVVKEVRKPKINQHQENKPDKTFSRNEPLKNFSLNELLRNNGFRGEFSKSVKSNPVKVTTGETTVVNDLNLTNPVKKNEKSRVNTHNDKRETNSFLKDDNSFENQVKPTKKIETNSVTKEISKNTFQTNFSSEPISGKPEKLQSINDENFNSNVTKKDSQNEVPLVRTVEEAIVSNNQAPKVTNAVFTKPVVQAKYISGIIQSYYDSSNQAFTQSQVVVDAGKMGSLDIRLNKDSGSQTILILVENDTIKTEMARILPHLAESLQSKGVPINSVNIDIGQSWNKNNKRNNNKNNSKQNLSQTMEGINDKDATINSKKYYGYNTMDITA
ncbi:MAG: flagellar hook-length control protein FliK [Calditrichaeota bacterium]|nr:MAG: flagellar hook-length control protein FliK [Calditrichota bacterium]MBL1204008.1 flagellar hook-length control protein FliK [Calditrichota bacterium]NOG43839.1 flagellar hook-length control protein FliK [Calditrichota bacterium]